MMARIKKGLDEESVVDVVFLFCVGGVVRAVPFFWWPI